MTRKSHVMGNSYIFYLQIFYDHFLNCYIFRKKVQLSFNFNFSEVAKTNLI